jgi:hypothetical protein
MTIEEFKKYFREWLLPFIEGANEDTEAADVVRNDLVRELQQAIQRLQEQA